MLHYFQNVAAKIKGLLSNCALLLLWTNNKVEQVRTQITLWILDRIFKSVAPIYWGIWMLFLVMFCSQWIEQTKNRACCRISLYYEFFSMWSSRSRIIDFPSNFYIPQSSSLQLQSMQLFSSVLRSKNSIFFWGNYVLCVVSTNVCKFRIIKVGNMILF